MSDQHLTIYRVTVRGQFQRLTDRARALLLASVDDHDIFKSSFTEEGTFTYDRQLVAFNLRYEVRLTSRDAEINPAEVALGEAEEFLRVMSIGHGPLRAAVMDMTAMTDRN